MFAAWPQDAGGCLVATKADTAVQAIGKVIGEAWLHPCPCPRRQKRMLLVEKSWPIPKELLAVTSAYFMLIIELPVLAMASAYAEVNVTIRIRSNRYYSAEYQIAIHTTIRPQSEYESY